MDKWIMISGGVLGLPVVASIASFQFWPGVLLKACAWFSRRRLGLVVRYAHSGSYRFCYCSRGTPGGGTPSLLLLHGFSGDKDMWLPVVKYLPRNQHVVCVDMPGHEGTSRTGAEDYSIQGQVGRIHEFVKSIGLDRRRFHLVGGSMGGNVAGVYAARYPAHLSSVTLFCPAGLDYPKDSKFISNLRELEKTQLDGPNPMIPSTPLELEEMFKLCFHTPPNLPRQIQRGFLDNGIPNNVFYKEVFKEIFGEESRYSLQENLHLITSPVQVIWGKEDQVVDVSGAAVLQAALPNCQVALLDNCGHCVPEEHPTKAAKLIVDFVSAQENSSENTKKCS